MMGVPHTVDRKKVKIARLAYLKRKKDAGKELSINQRKAAGLSLTRKEKMELRRG